MGTQRIYVLKRMFTMRYHLTPVRMAIMPIIKKTRVSKCW